MDEKKYSQLYQALLQEVLQFHSGNQRRIRKGMLSLLLVPLVLAHSLGAVIHELWVRDRLLSSMFSFARRR